MTSPYLRRPIRTIDQAIADLEAQADDYTKIEYEDADITVLVFEEKEALEELEKLRQEVHDSMALPAKLVNPDDDDDDEIPF